MAVQKGIPALEVIAGSGQASVTVPPIISDLYLAAMEAARRGEVDTTRGYIIEIKELAFQEDLEFPDDIINRIQRTAYRHGIRPAYRSMLECIKEGEMTDAQYYFRRAKDCAEYFGITLKAPKRLRRLRYI